MSEYELFKDGLCQVTLFTYFSSPTLKTRIIIFLDLYKILLKYASRSVCIHLVVCL
jgi:hypothetical protein